MLPYGPCDNRKSDKVTAVLSYSVIRPKEGEGRVSSKTTPKMDLDFEDSFGREKPVLQQNYTKMIYTFGNSEMEIPILQLKIW